MLNKGLHCCFNNNEEDLPDSKCQECIWFTNCRHIRAIRNLRLPFQHNVSFICNEFELPDEDTV